MPSGEQYNPDGVWPETLLWQKFKKKCFSFSTGDILVDIVFIQLEFKFPKNINCIEKCQTVGVSL